MLTALHPLPKSGHCLIRQACDTVAVLDGGRIAAHGPAPAILSDTALMTNAGLAPPEAAALLTPPLAARAPC
jgi:hypothetical protein